MASFLYTSRGGRTMSCWAAGPDTEGWAEKDAPLAEALAAVPPAPAEADAPWEAVVSELVIAMAAG